MKIKPRLPRSLLDQVQEIGDKSSGSKQSLWNVGGRTRKERRKQERLQKKQTRRENPTSRRRADSDSESDGYDEPEFVQNARPARRQSPSPKGKAPAIESRKPSTKDAVVAEKPASRKPTIRKAVADKLDEDDAEITALESKLNIKNKKLPSGFKEDNLDWLLEGLDSEDEEREKDRQYLAEKRGKKRKRDEVEAERNDRKRDNAASSSEPEEESEDSGSESDMFDESDVSSGMGEGDSDDIDMADEDSDWSGFSSDKEETTTTKAAASFKPDPTKPALPSSQTGKYVPPAQRRQLGSVPTDDVLRKKIQGQVNRLTEQSMLQIVKSIEDLYRDYPRQSVTSTLTTLVLASVSNEVNTRETFFTLYGGFIAALYKILGTDFGAHFVQSLVEEFDKCYNEALMAAGDSTAASSKKQVNDFVSLLAELYNFGVVGSTLMFDFIRIFVSEVAELNAELLLRIVRSSGPQLRQDDPSALKDIVSMLNASVAKVGSAGLSTRFKFMMETLTNLKNNKARKANDSSIVASEAIVRMKKTLGTLSNRSLRASEPLRPSLKDIRDIDKKGKWWLVGASWRNNMVQGDSDSDASGDEKEELSSATEAQDDVTNYLQLAREQRMNTDIRRAIFVAIMSAEDYTNAQEKLFKLRLKRNQEREIPHVLLHCCGNEAQYNPYYTLIAQQLCSHHSLRMTFQFSLWEVFRKMGEEDDMSRSDSNPAGDDDDDDKMPLRKVVNLAKLYGYLAAHGSLSLMILKTLHLVSLQPATRTFLEIFFITVFSEIRERYPKSSSKRTARIRELFSDTAENTSLARGLEYFLKKHVAGTDLTNGKKEREAVRTGCAVAEEVLRTVVLGCMEAA
ncbi:suppressor of glycerol defect [Orbilia brochopaga]|uniref:Suppressor of glycerol defect n=1 Tax=Orbilia brochopaga TaxID=3140254 RepID=A0AAV9UYL1_9PEZI